MPYDPRPSGGGERPPRRQPGASLPGLRARSGGLPKYPEASIVLLLVDLTVGEATSERLLGHLVALHAIAGGGGPLSQEPDQAPESRRSGSRWTTRASAFPCPPSCHGSDHRHVGAHRSPPAPKGEACVYLNLAPGRCTRSEARVKKASPGSEDAFTHASRRLHAIRGSSMEGQTRGHTEACDEQSGEAQAIPGCTTGEQRTKGDAGAVVDHVGRRARGARGGDRRRGSRTARPPSDAATSRAPVGRHARSPVRAEHPHRARVCDRPSRRSFTGFTVTAAVNSGHPARLLRQRSRGGL